MHTATYHILWTTYGTWLPGDARGWMKKGDPFTQDPDIALEQAARECMTEDAVVLTEVQRTVVEQTIRDHCGIRRWPLHAVNVRSNHVHLVATADLTGREVMKQLKAWCSRRLSDSAGIKNQTVARGAGRRRWFTEGGRSVVIRDDTQFETVVRDGQ